MAKLLKEKGTQLSETLVASLVKKYVHVPTNPHKVVAPTGGDGTVNAWFAGKVAGYEKAYIAWDYEEGKYLDEPKEFFNLLLCDGMGYVLSQGAEVLEISEEEFLDIVAENDAIKAMEAKVMAAEQENKKEIILPNKVITLPNGNKA